MNSLWAVTGASGYVGRALCENLKASGIAVRGLSRRGGDGLIAADIRDADALRLFVRDAAVVVHLAAYVHRPAVGPEAQRECHSVNVDGTRALIEAVAAENPRAFLVLISSASVYGPGPESFEEAAPRRPATAYGRSKAEAEDLFLSAVSAGRIRGCIVRPAMIFGPGAPGNLSRLIRMVQSGFAVEIGAGTQRKTLVPIANFIAAIRSLAACGDGCNGEVFNIGGESLTIHEILMTIAGALRQKVRIVRLPGTPVRIAASAADVLLRPFAGRVPSFSTLVETYSTSSLLDDARLRAVTGDTRLQSVRDALAALAGG